jgi:beta-lactamase class A
MTADVREHIEAVFEQAGCEGALCVQTLDGKAEMTLHADRQVSPASACKVPIALEAETWFADGRLDPGERVTLRADDRTLGPTGFSLFSDDVDVSWRDMVIAMLTISDNHTTDALLGRIGVDAVNATSARLGLTDSVITTDLRTAIDSLGQDAGFDSWGAMTAWLETGPPAEEVARATARVAAARALDPAVGTRTTARDMATLLRLIWSDQAGPPAACARVRAIMAKQLTKHRIAAGFRLPVRVAAKTGSLVGVVRNEIGVVTYPDGRQYAAAVFTRSRPGQDDAAINAAIGEAAAAAVAALRDGGV